MRACRAKHSQYPFHRYYSLKTRERVRNFSWKQSPTPSSRPTLSQNWSFKIRRMTFVNYVNLAGLLTMRFWICEKGGRVFKLRSFASIRRNACLNGINICCEIRDRKNGICSWVVHSIYKIPFRQLLQETQLKCLWLISFPTKYLYLRAASKYVSELQKIVFRQSSRLSNCEKLGQAFSSSFSLPTCLVWDSHISKIPIPSWYDRPKRKKRDTTTKVRSGCLLLPL